MQYVNSLLDALVDALNNVNVAVSIHFSNIEFLSAQ